MVMKAIGLKCPKSTRAVTHRYNNTGPHGQDSGSKANNQQMADESPCGGPGFLNATHWTRKCYKHKRLVTPSKSILLKLISMCIQYSDTEISDLMNASHG